MAAADQPPRSAPHAQAENRRRDQGRPPALAEDRHRDPGAPAAVAAGPADPGAPAAPRAEAEPDARYTFANERTFLAWTRTALAFIVAGLGIVQLLPPFPGVPWGRPLLGVPLIVLGAVIAVVGYAQWMLNQRALRRREPLRRSVLPRILAGAIAGMAVVSAVVLLLSAVARH
jgi:putative membrane protein